MDVAATGGDAIDGAGSGSPDAGGTAQSEVTERLLDAAVDVFAEGGFEAARVAEIARRAGLTTGAIYARWRGKRALIVDAVVHVSPQFMDLAAFTAGTPAPETLTALSTRLLDTHDAKSRDVMLEAFVSARRDQDFRAAISRSLEQEGMRLAGVVSSGKAEGSIDPALNVGAVVAAFQALRLGIHLVAAASDSHVPREDWEALIARWVAALEPAASGGSAPTDG